MHSVDGVASAAIVKGGTQHPENCWKGFNNVILKKFFRTGGKIKAGREIFVGVNINKIYRSKESKMANFEIH